MTFDLFITILSRQLPWGRHLFGIDIPGLDHNAFQIVDFNSETELVRVKAVGDNHIREHHVSDLYEIVGDVCSCGELNCEWHEACDE